MLNNGNGNKNDNGKKGVKRKRERRSQFDKLTNQFLMVS